MTEKHYMVSVKVEAIVSCHITAPDKAHAEMQAKQYARSIYPAAEISIKTTIENTGE